LGQEVKEEWVSYYDGSKSDTNDVCGLSIDFRNNIFVLGYCRNTNYTILIKYNDDGLEQWRRLIEQNSEKLYPNSIFIDSVGNIYFSCISYGNNIGLLFKYDTFGTELWRKENTYNIYKMCLDKFDKIYTVGRALVQYNSDGKEQWVTKFEKGSSANHLIVDNSNNIHTVGSKIYPNNQQQVITTFFNPKGIKLWEQIYISSAQRKYDNPQGITIDNSGNTYIIAISYGDKYWSDYLTIKYNSFGKELWSKKFMGSAIEGNDVQDLPYKICVDNNENVFVTGEIGNLNTHYDFGTLKYSAHGDLEWVNTSCNDSINTDWAYDMVLDEEKNIYVTGTGVVNKRPKNITVKYNSKGDELWIKDFGIPNSRNGPNKIAINKNNSIYVAGTVWNDNETTDFILIKYSQAKKIDSYIQIFSQANVAFKAHNYLLVLELLKDFPTDDAFYFEAIALMRQALAKLNSNNVQNFVTVSGNVQCGCNKAISGYIVFEDLSRKQL